MPLDRLSAQDHQILRLERGMVRGHVCKVLILEPFQGRDPPNVEQLRKHIDAKLDAAPRLRRRFLSSPLAVPPPVWADDPDFDTAPPGRGVPPAGPADRAELLDIV